jgi:hypothetical protein
VELPDEGFRIIGERSWTNQDVAPEDINHRFGFEFFVLDTDHHGDQTSLGTFEYTKKRNQIWDAAPMGRDIFVVGNWNWFGRIDAQGKLQSTIHLGETSQCYANPKCIIARNNGWLLCAGSHEKDAWAGEVDCDGKVVWEKTYDNGADQETAFALANRPDGGFVMAINSGEYNKFGMGPSKLCVLSCDAFGKKEAEAILADGRITPSAHPLILWTGDGCVLSFMRDKVGGVQPFDYDCFIASFDRYMKLRWEKKIRSFLGFPTPLLLLGPEGKLISIVGLGFSSELSIIQMSPTQKILKEDVLPMDGNYMLIDAILSEGKMTLLANVMLHPKQSVPNSRPEHVLKLFQIRS